MAFDIGLVGLGAIARKQHLPSIAKNGDFRLVAAASLAGEAEGVPVYGDHRAMLAAHPEIAAVVICTPPTARLAIAAEVMATGRAVMLEKPPAATPGGLAYLAGVAAARGVALHTAWHSQYNAAVDLVREMLRGERIRRLHMVWKEDVHKWHPGQQWIWDAGGFGVFDAGINGVSILTKILDRPLFAVSAVLDVPVDAAVPVAARVVLSDGSGAAITGDFDWLWQGGDTREIVIETEEGRRIELLASAARLVVDGTVVHDAAHEGGRDEYAAIYRDFAELLAAGRSSVDGAPLQVVADIFLVGRAVAVPAVRR